jgi:hypothetical protein
MEPYKLDDIYELVHKISLTVPKKECYKQMNIDLTKLEQSVKYTAPEALGRRWDDLYEILDTVPKNSQLERDVKEIFRTAGMIE